MSISSTQQPVAAQPAFYWTGSGDRNRTDAHSFAHSLGSLMVCLSESQVPPDLIQYSDTSPDALPKSSGEMERGWEKPLIWLNRKAEERGRFLF